jgi:hypothetical protein
MLWLSGVVFFPICFLRFVVSTSDTPISILRFYPLFLVYPFYLTPFMGPVGGLFLEPFVCPSPGSLLLSLCLWWPCLLSWTGLFACFFACFPLLFLAPEALTAVALIDLSPERESAPLCTTPSANLLNCRNLFLIVYCVCHAHFPCLIFCVKSSTWTRRLYMGRSIPPAVFKNGFC